MNCKYCGICGLPIDNTDPDLAHTYHDDDCPNYVRFYLREEIPVFQECECDNWAHPECCPQCNGKKVTK